FGLLAHTARVEHHQIGGVHRRSFLPAERIEHAGDPLRVSHIHLAADGPDVILARRGAHRSPPALACAGCLLEARFFFVGGGVSGSGGPPSSSVSASVASRTSSGLMRSM